MPYMRHMPRMQQMKLQRWSNDAHHSNALPSWLWPGAARKSKELESSHSPQVPPPRQCYSPGGVTIFTLPAVPLCPLWRNGNGNFKVIQNLGFLLDHPQNWITGVPCRHTLKISERSVYNFLSYLANRQTYKQTDKQTNKVWQKDDLIGVGKIQEKMHQHTYGLCNPQRNSG